MLEDLLFWIRKEFRVGTWNTYNKGKESLEDPLAEWVLGIYADFINKNHITFLQEIRDEEWIKALSEMTNYRYLIEPAGDNREYYGIIYREGISIDTHYKPRVNGFTRVPQIAKVEYKGNNLLFFHVHLDPNKAREEFSRLISLVKKAVEHYEIDRVVLLGDFNFRVMPSDLRQLGNFYLVPEPGTDTTFFGKERDTIDGIYVCDNLGVREGGVYEPNFGLVNNIKLRVVRWIDDLAGEGYLEKLTRKVSDHRPVYATLILK